MTSKFPRRRYPPPSPIRAWLNKPERERHLHIQLEQEKAIIDRAEYMGMLTALYGYQCLVCGTRKNLTLDHIRPLILGGKTELSNLQILCSSCNGAKNQQVIDYRPRRNKKDNK